MRIFNIVQINSYRANVVKFQLQLRDHILFEGRYSECMEQARFLMSNKDMLRIFELEESSYEELTFQEILINHREDEEFDKGR